MSIHSEINVTLIKKNETKNERSEANMLKFNDGNSNSSSNSITNETDAIKERDVSLIDRLHLLNVNDTDLKGF